MGILSEHHELPELGKLIKKYTYIRGTTAWVRNQTKSVIEKRYVATPALQDLMKISRVPATWVPDAIRYIFEELTVTDVLPSQIVPVLNSWGIKCDAVNLIVTRSRASNTIESVQFKFYAKKSQGRERYACMGHVGLVIQSKSAIFGNSMTEYWEKIVNVWKESESVRLSAIFRRKNAKLTSTDNMCGFPYLKYESYVNS